MLKPPAREQAQVNIRMPDDLRDRIKAAAEANNRSMNAEIVAALAKEYPRPEYSAEEFLQTLSRLAEPMSLDDSIDTQDALNATLKAMGVSFEVSVAGGDVIFTRVS